LPTKAGPLSRGEKSLYDQYGGQWRPHPREKHHNLHWDYKSAGKCTKWLNIPINNLPTLKKGLHYAKNQIF
jgi:hypothetical protein